MSNKVENFLKGSIGMHLPKSRRVRLILLCSLIILIVLIAVSIIFTYFSTQRSVQYSIAQQGIKMAESIAASVDRQSYKQFLAYPQYNDSYWKMRAQLNDAREKIGALYVYTLKVDNPQTAFGMIMGMPEDQTGFNIGTICTVPEKQVKLAYHGKTYYTDVLLDPEHGKYLSVGAPIIDDNNVVIGYIGIDFNLKMLDDVKSGVIKNSLSTFIFDVVFIVVLLITFAMLQRWYQKSVKETVLETEQTYQKEFQSFLASVRSIRHDFANHLHIINGLMEYEQFEKAKSYTRSLTTEIKPLDFSIKINSPALLILLQTKWEAAHNKQIEFTIDVSNDSFDYIQPTDLIKILSNLIDNAFDSTVSLLPENRMVKVTCKRYGDQYVFEVLNTGKTIRDQDVTKLFEIGFTTKETPDGNKRGFGLHIVKKTIQKYSGEVMVDSNNGMTAFRVIIPVHNELTEKRING